MEYRTWDEAAAAAVARIENESSMSGPLLDSLLTLDDCEDEVSAWVLGIESGERMLASDIVPVIQDMGCLALNWMRENNPHYSGLRMTELLVRKQHDYGHDNINNFGVIGIAIRVCDKVARIRNLRARGGAAANESLVDSYMDIMGYAAIAIMHANGGFQLPLAQDAA